MVRKMAQFGVCYLIGLFAASCLPSRQSLVVAGLLAFMGVSWFFLMNRKASRYVLLYALSIAGAMVYYSWYQINVYAPCLQLAREEPSTVTGVVDQVDAGNDGWNGYVLRCRNGLFTWRVSFSLNQAEEEGAPKGNSPFIPRIGDRLTVTARWTVPKDQYVFPANSYYRGKGVYLLADSSPDAEISATGKPAAFSLKRVIMDYRNFLTNLIQEILPGESGAALIAMICGDKSGLDSNTKTLLYRAGIGHMMSVSGAHLTIVCMLAQWLLKPVPMPKWVRFGVYMAAAAGFAIFAGLSNSVLRAVVMLFFVNAAPLFRRKADCFNSLGAAVVLLSVGNPFVIRDASFLLSAAGVFGIGVFGPYMAGLASFSGWKGRVCRSLIVFTSVSLTVLPVSLLFFDETSSISPLTNLLLVPLCTAALLLGLLVLLTGGAWIVAFPLLKTAGLLCDIVLAVCNGLGRMPWTHIPLGYSFFTVAVLCGAGAVILAFLLFQDRRTVGLTAVLFVGVLLLSGATWRFFQRDVLTVAVLRDTAGVQLILDQNGYTCVVDVSGRSRHVQMTRRYLSRMGISDVDALILTRRPDGAKSFWEDRLALWPVKSVFLPDTAKALSEEETILGCKPEPVSLKEGVRLHMNDGWQIVAAPDGEISVQYGEALLSLYHPERTLSPLAGREAGVCIRLLPDGGRKIAVISFR